MLPAQLAPQQFAAYPPDARRLAEEHLDLLRQLPLGFVPLLLREVIVYDWKFPAERKDLDHQFAYLAAMSPDELRKTMAPFAQLKLAPEIERIDWVNQPGIFSEQLSALLWATHQIDLFRAASIEFVHRLNATKPEETLPAPRVAIVMIGQGVGDNKYPPFRKLRPLGTYFKNVNPQNGRRDLLEFASARAASHPGSFAHWYIDGSSADADLNQRMSCISYASLEPVRAALVTKMRQGMQSMGPERLRTALAQMTPADLGLTGSGNAEILNRFQISVLTEGSGTQIFSTTFIQWSAREALRRARPLTLVARFTPRQREQSMRELLAGTPHAPVPDPEGSLIDADMGTYYTWINVQRLSGAEQARLLVWFEDHMEALIVAPGLAKGSVQTDPISVPELIQKIA